MDTNASKGVPEKTSKLLLGVLILPCHDVRLFKKVFTQHIMQFFQRSGRRQSGMCNSREGGPVAEV